MVATQDGCRFVSTANGNTIGEVLKSDLYVGKYCGSCGIWGDLNGVGYADAVDFVSDRIERTLGGFGIEVEYIKVEEV